MKKHSLHLWLTMAFLTIFGHANAQYHQEYQPQHAGKIANQLEKMQKLGSALYLAAHPDDENTEMMAYLANELNLRTGYLSLTRGDGGQNLIGPEKGKELGVLRSQELMQARAIDGGLQFFTRCNDFGYSKTASETLEIWDEEEALSDVVWVIRKFRPDVIITRFPSNGYGGHGHHTASAILAEKAFKAAANPERFPEQLEHVDPWQPERMLFNTSHWFYRDNDRKMDSSALMPMAVGKFNPLLGKDYNEIGALSSSQHKSQGFGEVPDRGAKLEFLDHTLGSKAEGQLMEGIETGWSRIDDGKKVKQHLDKASEQFKPGAPQKIIPHLAKAYEALQKLEDGYWKRVKSKALKNLILNANGVWLDALADGHYGVPGDSVKVRAKVINRNGHAMQLQKVEFPFGKTETLKESSLPGNEPVLVKKQLRIPRETPYTQPYWLKTPLKSKGMYKVDQQGLIGLPETPTPMQVRYHFQVEGVAFAVDKPVRYNWEDPVKGSEYRPYEIGPPVTLNLNNEVNIFPDNQGKKVQIVARASKSETEGVVRLDMPEGWSATPESHDVAFEKKGSKKTLEFEIQPPETPDEAEFKIAYQNEAGSFSKGLTTIDYDHITPQTLFPEAKGSLVKFKMDNDNAHIGYIMGSGDEVPENLEQLGYDVTMLDEASLGNIDLGQFDAIITGVRAYNTEDWLVHYHDKLMEFVNDGGNMIVQYSKSYNLFTEAIGPYPFEISRKRVTVEEAPVKMLDEAHPLLNRPNDITQADFQDWVQERGLYFADSWDEKYQPLLSSNDPDEDALKGGLLFAEYGEGAFMYTGYAFFRQLPVGVPGAYRLLANMIEYENQ